MIREWIFFAIESLALSAVLLCSWLLLIHALKKLGATMPATSKVTGLLIWIVVFGVDVTLTKKWGPQFTALYFIAGMAGLVALSIYAISVLCRITHKTGARP